MWKAFPLHPDTPAEGQTLERLFNADSEKVKAMVARLKQTAAQLGLPFAERTMTYNSRLAQELGLWAEDQQKGERFHMNSFEAYFVHGRNLADHDVLIDLASQSGLSKSAAETIIATRSYSARVDEHWQEAGKLGITAVPTFICGFNRVVGAQSYGTLAELVMAAGASRR